MRGVVKGGEGVIKHNRHGAVPPEAGSVFESGTGVGSSCQYSSPKHKVCPSKENLALDSVLQLSCAQFPQ